LSNIRVSKVPAKKPVVEPLFSNFLIGALLFVFVLIAACGICLIRASVSPLAAHNDPSSSLDLAINLNGIRIKITTAIPGLIVFLLGGAGLLLLAIRVPVKQVQHRMRARSSKDSWNSTLSMMTVERVVSERTERIPLLLWWIIEKRDIAERVRDSNP
jgi:hypothetical protein